VSRRCWNVARTAGDANAWKWVAVLYERQQDARGNYRWRKVRTLGRERPAKWAAEWDGVEWGAANGVDRLESAKHNAHAWRLDDYVDDMTQATARLGCLGICLAARSNAKTWSIAVCVRTPGQPWYVSTHLGTVKDRPHDVGRALGLALVYAARLPHASGQRMTTQEEIDQAAADRVHAREVRAATARRKLEQAAKRRAATRKRRAAQAVIAENVSDTDKAARLRSGKSKAKRKRAGKKAAATRKARQADQARRSAAGKKAAVTRKANALRRSQQAARRSQAAKTAWATRRTDGGAL